MTVFSRTWCIPVFAMVFVACGSNTGEATESEPSTITVSGEGVIEAEPDVVTLNIRVVTEDRLSAVATRDNAATTQSVIAALRKAMGKETQIQTTGYALTPQYEYLKTTSTRRLRGYQVRNSVLLRSGDLSGIGRAIDAASDAGANEIDSLTVGLRDDFEHRLQALAAATQHARSKADAIAAALGRKVARVVSVDESGSPPSPVLMRAQVLGSAPTPVETGNLELRAQVSMQVELTD